MRGLVNESVEIERGGERVQVIGTDDVHSYFSDQAVHAVEQAGPSFSIALVHPRLCGAAHKRGYVAATVM
jgi:hypothetical protein